VNFQRNALGSTITSKRLTDIMPTGWLKRNTDAFQPPLEPRLTKAISSIGYGTLDKVYMTFPEAFWNNSNDETNTSTPPTSSEPKSLLDPNKTTPNVTATTQPLHQPLASDSNLKPNSNKHQYPGFTHWLAPTYAPQTNPQNWDQQGMNLAALPDETAHPTLLFYVYGPCATHIASLASTTTTSTTSTATSTTTRTTPTTTATTTKSNPAISKPPSPSQALLAAYFHPYISRLPNYSASNPNCQPSGILATAWANDELAGYGSYANFQVGLEAGDEDIEVMRRGMPERGVWFAGEHTAPFVALGTSTGAYWSGEGVGRRIVLKAHGEGGVTLG